MNALQIITSFFFIAGLFHKAISQSGVALNTWASMPPNPKKYAYKLCSLLGRDIQDSRAIVHFLRRINCLKLIDAQEKLRSLEVSLVLKTFFTIYYWLVETKKEIFACIVHCATREENWLFLARIMIEHEWFTSAQIIIRVWKSQLLPCYTQYFF